MKASILLAVLVMVFAGSVCAQSCGFIFARFQVLNAKGEVVEDARLQLVYRNTDKSIMYREDEMSYSKMEQAYKFRHGLCGAHYDTRLIISHPAYEIFESVVDLPLNTPTTEHIFIINLKKKGSRDEASLEQLIKRYCMTVRDDHGAAIPRSLVKLLPTKQSKSRIKYAFITDEEGAIDVKIADGVYDLEVIANSYKRIKLKNQQLPYDSQRCVEVKLKSSIPPHQIT